MAQQWPNMTKRHSRFCKTYAGRGVLTLLVAGLLAELLHKLVDLGMHHHLILVPDAVLTQEVKLDVISLQALHILYLR